MENFIGTCALSSIPLRANPSHRSEIVSQLLFADVFEAFEQQGDWLQIKTFNDAYIGWVDAKQVSVLNENNYTDSDKSFTFLTKEANTLVLKGNSKSPIYLHAGTTLPNYNEGKFSLLDETYQVTSNNVFVPNAEDFEVDVVETAKTFL